eukprot:6189200-Pleurochrysis_carterae.AAC.1
MAGRSAVETLVRHRQYSSLDCSLQSSCSIRAPGAQGRARPALAEQSCGSGVVRAKQTDASVFGGARRLRGGKRAAVGRALLELVDVDVAPPAC